MKFDLAHPTARQLREGLVTGLIAESVAVPVLITAALVGSGTTHWWYLLGAIGCYVVSVVYLAFFVVVTKGKAGLSGQANAGFVVVCLAMSALGLIALGSSDSHGAFTPAVLVGVVFVSVIGGRRMRIAVDLYAIALVIIVSWAEGLRGTDLASVLIVYTSTIVIITWIVARTLRSLNSVVTFSTAVDVLHEAFAEPDPVEAETSTAIVRRVFGRALPLVNDVVAADSIVVFARSSKLGAFTPLVTWNAEPETVLPLSERPELPQALRADAPVVTDTHCAIPVGFCAEGELVMMVVCSPGESRAQPAEMAADLLASAFLRVTSRANFVSGLHAESRTDPLTGLANRRSLFERIEMEMAHALRSESPLSVAMIDLDHFKVYNDHFGHVAGDTLLRSIAAVMVSNIRGQDLVARYGGEKFRLVMPDTDLVGGHHLLETLRAGGRDATSEFPVTLSAGLTSWDGVEDTTSFIERADQALYRAKETGRNRVVSIQAFTEF